MDIDNTKIYAILQCYHCGLIQGRQVIGHAWGYSGKFKTVTCVRCFKKIDLSKANIFFRSNDPIEASEWVKEFKMNREKFT